MATELFGCGLPDTALGPLNRSNTLQVLESGAMQQTFQARAIVREYDQVSKHKIGGGVSGKIAVVAKLGASGAYESELRQTLSNGVPVWEQIKRIRSGEVRAGLE